VYDITNAKSFESLSERWMAQLNDHSNADDLAKLLVGNKSDMGESAREVTKEKASAFCQEYGMEFLETSAKSGDNVLRAFEKLIGIVHDRALNASKTKAGGVGGPGGLKGVGVSGKGDGSSPSANGGGMMGEDGTVHLGDGTGPGGGPDGSDAANACGC